MQTSAELEAKLRRLIDERIPEGGSEASTRLDNSEITELITDNASIEAAAAAGWELKASRVFGDRGGMVSSTAGDETTKWVDPEKFAAHCLAQAALFRSKIPGATTGSRVFEIDYPLPPGVAE